MKQTIKKMMKLYQDIGKALINLLIKVNYNLEYRKILRYLKKKHLLLKDDQEKPNNKKFKQQYENLKAYVPSSPYKIFSRYLKLNNVAPWKVTPENIICNYVSPILNPIGYRKFYEDKNVYGILFGDSCLPKALIRRMNGIYLDEAYHIINTLSSNILYTLIRDHQKIIVKPTTDTSSGRGVKLFIRNDQAVYHLFNHPEVKLTPEYLSKEYGDNFIIQECIEQSSFTSAFNEESVNTFRIGCYKSVKDNEPKILFVGIRMGSKGSYVDNTHAGGAKIRVNPDGSLANYAIEGYGNIVRTYNGIDFQNETLQVPNFEKIVSFVKNLHNKIPHMRLIAFDVMLDKNNEPKLIEYNISGFSTWLPQWTGQCVLGDYTEEIIKYCSENKDKIQKVSYFIN